jgi:hypothetical protein
VLLLPAALHAPLEACLPPGPSHQTNYTKTNSSRELQSVRFYVRGVLCTWCLTYMVLYLNGAWSFFDGEFHNTTSWAHTVLCSTLVALQSLISHSMICHSKRAIDPAPCDVIRTTRWNNTPYMYLCLQ